MHQLPLPFPRASASTRRGPPHPSSPENRLDRGHDPRRDQLSLSDNHEALRLTRSTSLTENKLDRGRDPRRRPTCTAAAAASIAAVVQSRRHTYAGSATDLSHHETACSSTSTPTAVVRRDTDVGFAAPPSRQRTSFISTSELDTNNRSSKLLVSRLTSGLSSQSPSSRSPGRSPSSRSPNRSPSGRSPS